MVLSSATDYILLSGVFQAGFFDVVKGREPPICFETRKSSFFSMSSQYQEASDSPGCNIGFVQLKIELP